MKKLALQCAGLMLTSLATTAMAAEGPVPAGMPHLDHVFLIVMENHGYGQIVNNPTMPFINGMITSGKVSLATQYYAIGHPSLPNYLELVGGSNFGILSDNNPDWHNHSCQSNLQSGLVNADNNGGNAPVALDPSGKICPISGTGADAATQAVDNWNEVSPPFNYLAGLDGVRSVPLATNISGKTIADQLVTAGLTWKSYQENLPTTGADLINFSNGTATNLTTFNAANPQSFDNLPPLTGGSVLKAYAVKHNPFAYFQNVQDGTNPANSLANLVGFEGPGGLFADLASGHVPNFALIAPNQCNDQHGRGNGDAFCQYDPGLQDFNGQTYGTQAGMNPGLAAQADVTLRKLVGSIEASPAWHRGHNAIVIVWDENDYSGATAPMPDGTPFPVQNQNNVVLAVETNHDDAPVVQSSQFYDSYAVLKTLEGGFRLPCLNHACDGGVQVMADLFGARH